MSQATTTNTSDTPAAPPRDRPIRVLHYINQWTAQGGIETFLMNIFRSADTSQVKCDLLVPTPGSKSNELDGQLEDAGVTKLYCPRYARSFHFAGDFKRIVDEHGPYDIVHAHNNHVGGSVIRQAARLGITHRVAHAHNDLRRAYNRAGFFKKRYFDQRRGWIDRYATHGLAASENAGLFVYRDGWGRDPRWRPHYYGIELDRFAGPFDGDALRGQLGIPRDAKVAGHVGRFHEQKNHPYLIRVAAELIKLEPDTVLLLIGDGPGRPAAEQQAKDLGIADKVVFAGMRSDVPALMASVMDVFLFPSLFEGFGIVLIEAQAAGLPYVATDVVPTEADIIQGFGVRHRLDEDPAAWARSAQQRLNQPRPMDQPAALASLRGGPFDSASSGARLFDFYRGLVDG